MSKMYVFRHAPQRWVVSDHPRPDWEAMMSEWESRRNIQWCWAESWNQAAELMAELWPETREHS